MWRFRVRVLMSSSIQGHPSLWRGSVTPLDHSVMDEARVPALFSIIARGDLFASISAMRCAEAKAVDRAQRYLRGEGVGPLWRRLSDAIGRRARIVRLYWVVRAHRESVDDAWAGPYSGSEEG